MKRIACLMLSFIIMIGASVSAYAAQPTDEAEPQSLYSSKPTVVFLISENGKASVKLKCMGNRDVTKITSKTCIDKKVCTKWVRVNVGTSDNYLYLTANSSTLIASHPVSLTGSGSYRCITTFTLYAKTSEPITLIKFAEY